MGKYDEHYFMIELKLLLRGRNKALETRKLTKQKRMTGKNDGYISGSLLQDFLKPF